MVIGEGISRMVLAGCVPKTRGWRCARTPKTGAPVQTQGDDRILESLTKLLTQSLSGVSAISRPGFLAMKAPMAGRNEDADVPPRPYAIE